MKTFNWIACSATVLLGLGLGLSACDDGPSAAPPAAVAAAPQAAVEAAAAPTTLAIAAAPYVYSYNPLGKRDPFRSPMDDLMQAASEQMSTSCSDPLCQYDLGQLRLVAVVTGDSNPMAMVEDPLGRGHVVRRSARIGRQGGTVTQILRDSVTVTERFKGTDGQERKNLVSMQITPDAKVDTAYNLLTGKNWE